MCTPVKLLFMSWLYASCCYGFVALTPSCFHYRLQLLLLVARVWRVIVTTAVTINIRQLLLCVVLIWPCYHPHCCHHHNRAGKHHGARQYLGSQLWPYVVERRHGHHYNFNVFHSRCVTVWLHARRFLRTESRRVMVSQDVYKGCSKHP